jgi:hypothetical protein
MNKIFIIGIFLLSLSKIGFNQNINLIIQVNDKLVESGISAYLVFGFGNETKRILVSYVPGELILDEKAWALINSDTLNKFSLKCYYTIYSKDNEESFNFYVDLNKKLLMQPYLILNIYDFQDKKYRRWYSWHTDKDFLAELRFPNSGIYVRRK